MATRKNCFNYRYTLLVLCFLLILPITALASSLNQSSLNPSSLNLRGPSSVVKEGYFTVSVDPTDVTELNRITIEVASNLDFTEDTREFPALGHFNDISLTGFSDGKYYLRARVENASGQSFVSNTIEVTVKHYPLWQALSLFFVGLIIFITLVATLLLLHRQWVHSRKIHHD